MTTTAEAINELARRERKSPSLSDPLYELEHDLLELLDTEGLVPAEQEAEFQVVLYEQLKTTVSKRDRVGQFIRGCELQAANSKEEKQRQAARQAMYEHAAEKAREWTGKVIESLGRDEKGKWRKLEGNTVTLSLRNNPQGVKILDEAEIPPEYKNISIKLSAVTWESIIMALPDAQRASVIQEVDANSPKLEVSKTKIKKAFENGDEVAGADLEQTTALVIR